MMKSRGDMKRRSRPSLRPQSGIRLYRCRMRSMASTACWRSRSRRSPRRFTVSDQLHPAESGSLRRYNGPTSIPSGSSSSISACSCSIVTLCLPMVPSNGNARRKRRWLPNRAKENLSSPRFLGLQEDTRFSPRRSDT